MVADGIHDMVRVQIQLDERQLQALREQAASEHASVSSVVRRAVNDWMDARTAAAPQALRERAMAAAGRFASGHHDVAERHDDYLTEA
jgi:Arc/MetJ-type ribon-helix-helix transcriptional regulator